MVFQSVSSADGGYGCAGGFFVTIELLRLASYTHILPHNISKSNKSFPVKQD